MRDTYKYHLKDGKRIVHRGITAEYPGTQISQVGRRTTREAALDWERNGGRR